MNNVDVNCITNIHLRVQGHCLSFYLFYLSKFWSRVSCSKAPWKLLLSWDWPKTPNPLATISQMLEFQPSITGFYVALRTKFRVSYMLGKYCATELHPWPCPRLCSLESTYCWLKSSVTYLEPHVAKILLKKSSQSICLQIFRVHMFV